MRPDATSANRGTSPSTATDTIAMIVAVPPADTPSAGSPLHAASNTTRLPEPSAPARWFPLTIPSTNTVTATPNVHSAQRPGQPEVQDGTAAIPIATPASSVPVPSTG